MRLGQSVLKLTAIRKTGSGVPLPVLSSTLLAQNPLVGDSVLFAITATGEPVLSYRWESSIDNVTFTDITETLLQRLLLNEDLTSQALESLTTLDDLEFLFALESGLEQSALTFDAVLSEDYEDVYLEDSTPLLTEASSSLAFIASLQDDNKWYRVVVTNGGGSVTSPSVQLNVFPWLNFAYPDNSMYLPLVF